MLRSCLIILLVCAAFVAGYYWWLSQQFDPPGVWIGAVIVGLISAGCVGSVINAGVSYREWSLLSAARHDLPWSDGRWTALAGEIHPFSEPVIAPFSGAPCVMCEYDVTSASRAQASEQNENSNPGSDFTGFLMNPCVVRTKMGDVRLLGFPNLVNFGERICSGTKVAHNAYAFLTTTQFEDYSGLKMISIFSVIKDAWNDDDGLVRKHARLTKDPPESLFPAGFGDIAAAAPAAGGEPSRTLDAATDEMDDLLAEEDANELDEEEADAEVENVGDSDEEEDLAMDEPPPSQIPMLKEKRVKVGDQVCAIGIYSGDKRGLVPGGLGADHFIKLIRGRITDVERQARNSTFGRLIGGLIALVVVNAATYGVIMANRYHPAARQPRERKAFQMVRTGDVAGLEKLVRRGVDVNSRDENGQTLLWNTHDPAVARWLVAHGADVNAASNDGLTPLAKAIRNGDDELAALLRQAGAKE